MPPRGTLTFRTRRPPCRYAVMTTGDGRGARTMFERRIPSKAMPVKPVAERQRADVAVATPWLRCGYVDAYG